MKTKRSDRLIRLPEVKSLTGLSRSSIYSGVAAGTFPAPIKIGARAVAWSHAATQRWIHERIRAARGDKAAA